MDEAVNMAISQDVADQVVQTRQLVNHVAALTDRLERESDTALLAIAGWGFMPRRSAIFTI